MTEEQEKLIQRIKSLPVDPEYKFDPNVPIPLGRGVLVKKIESQIQTVTEAGLLLTKTEATPDPHLGIIQAVGPLCSEYIRPGLRCYYNYYVDSSFYVSGKHYAKMEENDVYYLVPPNVALFESPKSDTQKRLEKKHADQDSYLIRKHKHDQEEKDNKEWEKKKAGKIKPVK